MSNRAKQIRGVVALLIMAVATLWAAVGSQVTFTLGTTPGNPSSGKIRIWANTATGFLECLNSSGTSCFASSAGIFGTSTATSPSFSATPTFSLADVSSKSPVRVEPGVMTANVTAVTFSNKTAGARFSIVWKQDSTGGRTLTHGASATNTCEASIATAANAATTQFYEVGADGSTVNGVGCILGSSDMLRGPEEAAPGTPASSTGVCWFDSTNHIFSCKLNNSSTVSSAVVPLTCTSQVFSALSAAGVLTCHTITSAELPAALASQTSINGVTRPASGASGGVTCWTSSSVEASSGALTANLPVVGGGAGVCPTVLDPSYATLTDGATITWAIASARLANAKVTLGGNRTLNITNPANGGDYTLNVTQDGTGSRTLTLGTGCTWKVINGGSGAVTLTTTASATDIISIKYDGTNCWATYGKNFN